MKNYGLRLLFILAITAVGVWLVAAQGIKLGLDLAGGSSLTYRVVADEGGVPKEKIEKAIAVIQKRLDGLGVSEVYIVSTSADEILVEMPGRSKAETESIKNLIERNGVLEFRIRAPQQDAIGDQDSRKANPAGHRTPAKWRWVPSKEGPSEMLVETPEVPLRHAFEDLQERHASEEEIRRAEKKLEETEQAEVFRGEDLSRTYVTQQGAQTVVGFEFLEDRKAAFGDFTARNVRRPMAMILDGKVESAPEIESPIEGSGIIRGGGAGFTRKEANDLVIVLQSGSTGVKLEMIREESLGASLGAVAIEAGRWSVVVGFGFVMLLMVWYYRGPGLVACFALLLNVAYTLGALAFFRGALSLPGIAGIVLGLGMSIDANILIFERLRDERKRGKTLAESLAAGYDNAMSAIIDGNITALLSAAVLVAMGSGPVRGFGVTLAIGLLASMFTAVWVTRCVFEFVLSKGWLTSFDIGKDPWQPKLDYMRGRRAFVLPSLVLMVAGVLGFLSRDDTASKDLEFIGGQQVIVQMDRPFSASEISAVARGPNDEWEGATAIALAREGVPDAPAGTTNRWQIRAKAENEEKGSRFVEHLRNALSDALLSPGFSEWTNVPESGADPARVTFLVHTLAPVPDLPAFEKTLTAQGMTGVRVEATGPGAELTLRVTATGTARDEIPMKEDVRKALLALPEPVQLSDPFPAVSYLSPAQAQTQWRAAIQAVLVALAFQIVYIRVRFADYSHGFAAAVALIHDVTVTMGAVALFDSLGLVYAKVNLVMIAAFLTLIGYSMNDTIVIFDRIRENLGRSKVIRSRTVNDSINQTFSRSVRTSVIVFATVVVQLLFNMNLGSAIEGFAFVMTVGVIAGSYSTYFIASPLLLFLPEYGQRLTGRRGLFAGMCVATLVGAILAITAQGHSAQLWIGVALASSFPVHFLAYFVPWLAHPDPDSLIQERTDAEERERPLASPGI